MKRESEEKARRGRPPMAEGETLDAVIPASRCKASEREAFERAARRAGLTLTQWVRETLIQAIKK